MTMLPAADLRIVAKDARLLCGFLSVGCARAAGTS
jgi:hypothetical protein